jgi:periplasmic divalent cation tolerance protein
VTDIIEVHTTLPSREQANELARRLVESRLAACVQVLGPIDSIYRWEGKVEQSQEWLLRAKTSSSLYIEMEKMVRDHHPYQLPEVMAHSVRAGSLPYLKWVADETRPK